LRVLFVATALAMPAAAASQLVPNAMLGMAFVWLAMCCAAMALGPVTAAIQALTPVPYRAQAAAVLYLLIYIVAFMGIPLAGALTDGLFGDPKRLGQSLVVIGVVFGLLSMWVVFRGRQAHLAALAERQSG
jgi:hypothetical protein